MGLTIEPTTPNPFAAHELILLAASTEGTRALCACGWNGHRWWSIADAAAEHREHKLTAVEDEGDPSDATL